VAADPEPENNNNMMRSENMDSLLLNPYVVTLLYFIATVPVVLVGVILFELITTKYKDWQEIENGNYAVALSVGGKIVGICIILTFSIFHNDTVLVTMIWGGYGILLQLAAYYLFEFFTRQFSVETQLKERNLAVGIISFCVSVGLAFVIGASIT
jgi:putative membrane protein